MNLFRRDGSRRKVEQLIRDGIGVREHSWALTPASTGAPHPLVEPVTLWVRESMASMRRPYGIDQVALALACRDHTGRIIVSNSFGVLRPQSFYGDDGPNRIASFFDDVTAAGGDSAEIVGALLSLGDLAYEMNARAAA